MKVVKEKERVLHLTFETVKQKENIFDVTNLIPVDDRCRCFFLFLNAVHLTGKSKITDQNEFDFLGQ